jgi:hypothetical protein
MSTTTKTRRQLSPHAQAAKAIRTKLKTVYPSSKFSVTSESFAGGDAVRIDWTDGPTTDAVDALVSVHQEGHFDGMIDLYEYTNVHPNVAQAKYVQTSRGHSPEALAGIVAHLNQYWGWELRIDERGWIARDSDAHLPGVGMRSHEIHRAFHKLSLVCPACKTPTQVPDKFCPECGGALTSDDDE